MKPWRKLALGISAAAHRQHRTVGAIYVRLQLACGFRSRADVTHLMRPDVAPPRLRVRLALERATARWPEPVRAVDWGRTEKVWPASGK